MQRYDDNLAAPGANGGLLPLSGVSVTVTDKATGLPALLYADDAVTLLTQPLVTGNDGGVGFRAPDGTYVLTFTGPRIATFTREIVLDDPKDNPYASKAELTAFSGATLIGYKRPSDGALLTVSAAIDSISASNSSAILGTLLAGLSTATNAAITTADSILVAFGKLQKQITDLIAAKDASGGYAGLTLFKINFKNAANTFTSFLTNANTAARTYTFPNKDITVAGLDDIPTPGSMNLLAQFTVSSAVANIDFLNTFTSAYDRYVIDLIGVSPTSSGTDFLAMQFANAGTVDATTVYTGVNTSSLGSPLNARFPITDTTNLIDNAALNAVNGVVEVMSVNSTVVSKTISVRAAYSAYAQTGQGRYNKATVVSGFRLLWSAGTTFSRGTVRVYGIKNS